MASESSVYFLWIVCVCLRDNSLKGLSDPDGDISAPIQCLFKLTDRLARCFVTVSSIPRGIICYPGYLSICADEEFHTLSVYEMQLRVIYGAFIVVSGGCLEITGFIAKGRAGQYPG